MGFLKKLFSRSDGGVTKYSEPYDEDSYWRIIAKSLETTSKQLGQSQFLIREIEKLPLADIVGFRLRTDKLLFDTHNPEMWCAAYIINGGCSDDGFEYFKNWVISRGKDVFNRAMENPDSLADIVDKNIEFYEFEEFWFVALDAFEGKTGLDLYDHIDHEKFKTCEGNYPDFEFTWQEDDPESMRDICPKLFRMYLAD